MIMYKKGEHSWIRYIKMRIRSNLNFLALAEGSTGCLSKDTIIAGQTKPIGELYHSGERIIDTISISQPKTKKGKGGYYPKKSKSEIIPSGIKEVYEIELEDGRKVIATEKHTFFKIVENKFCEERVNNLKVGDALKTFPQEYVSNYYNKVNELQKIRTRNKTNNKYVCKNCGNLIFFDKYYMGCGRKTCDYCKDQKITLRKTSRNLWYGWEDNLLRQFYYEWEKEKIKELLPHRSWSSIMHRAKRLQIKRMGNLKWRKNAWTSTNNPIHNPISKEKMIKNKQKQIFKRNKMTSIEKKIADFLDNQNIKYDFNKVVRTKTSFKFPDFKIGNLIIECDGVHWHQMRSEEDKERQKELEELGFEVIRFTDEEINKDWEATEQCIKQKLNL